jgi:hypothetical protein
LAVKVVVVETAVVNLLRVAIAAEMVLVATTVTLKVLASGQPMVKSSLLEMVVEKVSVSETVAKTSLALEMNLLWQARKHSKLTNNKEFVKEQTVPHLRLLQSARSLKTFRGLAKRVVQAWKDSDEVALADWLQSTHMTA